MPNSLKSLVKVREMAIAVVDALMSNWQGDVGTRLAIKQEVSDGERDLGGRNWNAAVETAAEAIAPFLRPNARIEPGRSE